MFHLRVIKKNPPGFSVREHFDKPGHGLDVMRVTLRETMQGF